MNRPCVHKVWLSLPLVCVLLSACQSVGERDAAALRADAAALSTLAQVNNSISTTRSVSPDMFRMLKAIQEKYPNAPEIRQTYRNALVLREDWAALETFFAELPEDKLTAEDRKTLGKTLLKSGKYEKAIETLKPLADTDQTDVDSNSYLGQSYFFLGRTEEAGLALDKVWNSIVADKRVDEITMRGLIYERQNNFPKAVETLKSAIEIAPQNVAASNALSQTYARMGNMEQAELYRKRTVEINEGSAAKSLEASRRVQKIYELETAWKTKNYSRVIELANELLPNEPPDRKLALYQYLAESHRALGNQQAADSAMAAARGIQQNK